MSKITLTNVYESKEEMDRKKIKEILIRFIKKQTA